MATFRSLLDEKFDLAAFMYRELAQTPGFELPWEPELTVVPFRFVPRDGDPQAFNRRLLERINASKRVFLSSTTIDGSFMLRPCIVNHRTHRDRIEEAVQIIRAAAADLDS
jgi:aromatic-L-amino-acid decarboxylase